MTAHDTGYAPDRWAFDHEVTRVFDDMLRRSIPDLDTMRELVLEVGSVYVKPDSRIMDLGASRGDSVAPFLDRFGVANKYELYELSEPMRGVLAERFASWIDLDHMEVWAHDLARPSAQDPGALAPRNASLALSVLTLMFIPVELRPMALAQIRRRLLPGGALILVEKTITGDAQIQEDLTHVYDIKKRMAGYTDDEIARKKLSLENRLVPLTPAGNEELLRSAGFQHIATFWQALNFRAWVAV